MSDAAQRLPSTHNGRLVFAVDAKLLGDAKALQAALVDAQAEFDREAPAVALETEAAEHAAHAKELMAKAREMRAAPPEDEHREG